MTDQEHAAAIKAAVEAFHAAADEAIKAGLRVDATVQPTWRIGPQPSPLLHAEVSRPL